MQVDRWGVVMVAGKASGGGVGSITSAKIGSGGTW